jgi:hypothetical protein
MTYTKTYTIMDAWAQTVPHAKDDPRFPQAAREGDPCCAPQCDEVLRADEVAYAPVHLDRAMANPGRGEPWVCWRHIRPDQGPIRI